MISVPFPHSYSETFVKALHAQRSMSGSQYLVGPSPFEIPESVEASVDSPNQMTFRFWYPNAELAETEERAASHDGTITCKLARETKKILEVTLHGDVLELVNGGIDLKPQYFASISQSATLQTRNAFEQNLHVIRSILGSIPEQFHRELKSRIAKTWKQHDMAALQ
jgi:hypothetical protein